MRSYQIQSTKGSVSREREREKKKKAHLSNNTSERTSFRIELKILIEERSQISRVEVDSELKMAFESVERERRN